MLGLPCCAGFSLNCLEHGSFLVVVRWLLTAVASLVAEHKLEGTQASVAVAHGFMDSRAQAQ